MGNSSIEVSLSEHPLMVKERADHLPVVIFTKDNIDADKSVPVLNLPLVRFIVFPTSQ